MGGVAGVRPSVDDNGTVRLDSGKVAVASPPVKKHALLPDSAVEILEHGG